MGEPQAVIHLELRPEGNRFMPGKLDHWVQPWMNPPVFSPFSAGFSSARLKTLARRFHPP